jgi:DNA-binding NarL/FixJ family response regulator
MSMKLSVHLPDRISQNIRARAIQTGSSIENVVTDTLKKTFSTAPKPSKKFSDQERALRALIAAGLVHPKRIPRRPSRRISPKRREELAESFSKGKPLSQIIIEGRGERV